MKNIIGRKAEIEKFDAVLKSKKSEFVAVYGRRRVGKTFLIREFFDNQFTFSMSGIFNVSLAQQLYNFCAELSKYSKNPVDKIPENWFEAFQQLAQFTAKQKSKKKVLFIDELPWFDTSKSNFVKALEHFWNSWASARKDVILVVCGSSASWMIKKLVKNTGGLHNRITSRMKINPFTLKETELFLKSRNINFNRHQIIELYMVMGGIPYYLESVKKGKSVAQNIDESCFEEDGVLRDEFLSLYASLFKNYKNHLLVVGALSKKTRGLTREEILFETKLSDGGGFTKVLEELEESGFIRKYLFFESKGKGGLYQLIDFYSLFYYRFIQGKKITDANFWANTIDHPSHRAWSGYTFEQICLMHIDQIKKALGISGIVSLSASWKSKTDKNGAQIDLLIDRRDQVITLCEMKYSINKFGIDKSYSENLRNKIGTFKAESKTKKAVHLAMITTYGVLENEHYLDLVQNSITINDLFD
jgi:uncharacterized protein